MNQSVHSLRSQGQDQRADIRSERSLHSEKPNNISNREKFDKLIKTYQKFGEDDISSASTFHKVEVSPQETVPLIKGYSDENSKLKQEKGLIIQEMSKLQKISNILLSENDKLYQHCVLRTLDLKKTAETISLNLWEQENDLKHRIHLYREQNNSIIRALSEMQKQSSKLQDQLNRGNTLKEDFNRNTKQTQFKILQSEARIHDLESQIKNLKSKQIELTTERIKKNEKIDDYVLQNVDIRTFNRDSVLQLHGQSKKIQQKPKMMNQNQNLHFNIIRLKTEFKQIQEQLAKKQKQIDLLAHNLERQRKENQQKQNKTQANTLVIKTLQDTVKRMQKQTEQSSIRCIQQENQLKQLSKKKEELSKNLQSANAELKSKENFWSENIKQNRSSKISNCRNLQNTISKNAIKFAHEKATLQYSIKQLKNQTEYIREQAESVQQQIDEMQRSGESVSQLQREISKLNNQISQQQRKIAFAAK